MLWGTTAKILVPCVGYNFYTCGGHCTPLSPRWRRPWVAELLLYFTQTFMNFWKYVASFYNYLWCLLKVGWGSNTAVPRAIWRMSIYSDANRYVPQSSGHDTDRNTTNAQHLLWSPKNYGACNAIYVSFCWGISTGHSSKSSLAVFSHGRTKLQQLNAPSANLLVIFLWTAAAQQCSRSSWNSLSSPETTVQTYSDILTLTSDK